MPSSLQARMTRRAISPRLATRMRWNMSTYPARNAERGTRNERQRTGASFRPRGSSVPRSALRVPGSSGGIDPEQHLVVLDVLAVLDDDFLDDARDARGDLVVDLHRLDQPDHGRRRDAGADADVRGGPLLL